jgi:A/G-specific adenine glycosylase
LLRWYGVHARDLPWRRDRDPYRVWLSEVMLQQTTVAAVQPYFQRFVAKLPAIAALAAAREEQVLRLWEGLGYYRRARQLHRAAKMIVAEHGGRFPSDADAVRRLPGIGRYTAGAILSIAFDQPLPILEANTVRLLSRLLAFRGETRSAAGLRLLWHAAETLLPRRQAGQLNQALMELGSQVCKPREPSCEKCPVATMCPTHRDGLHEVIPALAPKPRVEEVREAAVVVRRRGRVLLVRCRDGERWAGLWDFPRFACDGTNGSTTELRSQVLRRTAVAIGSPRPLVTIRHTVTRFRITLECFEAPGREGSGRRHLPGDIKWLKPADLADYPLSSTGRKLARMIVAQSRSS